MSRTSFRLLLAAMALVVPGTVAQAQAQKDGDEPPAEFVLEIGEKAVTVPLGKEVEIPTTSPSTKVKLAVRKERLFDRSGVRFRYPTQFVFSSQVSSGNLYSWSFTGANCAITLQRSPRAGSEGLLASVLDEVRRQYGAKNVRTSVTSLRGVSKTFKGSRLNINLAGGEIIQEWFSFDSGPNTFILMLQDAQASKTGPSAEMKRIRQLFGESFAVSEGKPPRP